MPVLSVSRFGDLEEPPRMRTRTFRWMIALFAIAVATVFVQALGAGTLMCDPHETEGLYVFEPDGLVVAAASSALYGIALGVALSIVAAIYARALPIPLWRALRIAAWAPIAIMTLRLLASASQYHSCHLYV